jgi:hypothetical protein
MAPSPSRISCRRARSSSVAAPDIQSCSIPAPSPNGFSLLSFGPVTYPSSDMDMSQITVAMGSFLSVLQTIPHFQVPTRVAGTHERVSKGESPVATVLMPTSRRCPAGSKSSAAKSAT